MSLVYDVDVGAVARFAATITWRIRSYSVITLSWCGANFGGVTSTHAPVTAGVELSERSLIVAVTGPSDASSNHSVFCQKSPMPFPVGDAECPAPPRTSK